MPSNPVDQLGNPIDWSDDMVPTGEPCPERRKVKTDTRPGGTQESASPLRGLNGFSELSESLCSCVPPGAARQPAAESEFFALVMEEVAIAPPPEVAGRYLKPQLKTLVCICAVLQRVAGSGVFYLDARTAGRLLGVPRMTAWRHLKLLCSRGTLELVATGDRAERRASEFRYVGEYR